MTGIRRACLLNIGLAPSGGQAGLEPAHLLFIGQLPLPAWLLARGGSERGSRTRDLLVMGQVLCHLSYLAVGKGGVEPQSVAVSERRSNLLSCLPMNFLA